MRRYPGRASGLPVPHFPSNGTGVSLRDLARASRHGVFLHGLLLAALASGTTKATVTSTEPSPLSARVPPAPQGVTFVNSGQFLGGETGNGVALGDLDGDGDVDAIVANGDTPSQASENPSGGASRVWLNDGRGLFAEGDELGPFGANGVALADLDGDGDLDAVTAGGFSYAWLNSGSGQFDNGPSFGGIGTGHGVALGDVDNDGDVDAVVVGNGGRVFLNDGKGTFQAGPVLSFLFSRSAVVVDLDADGWQDVAVADAAEGTSNRVFWNDGNWTPGPGSFTPGAALPTTNLMVRVAVANLDGDARPDIFLAGLGPDQVYWNEGSRTFSTKGAFATVDSSWALALGDVDGDGNVDAVVGNITAEPNRLWHNEGGRVFAVTQEFGDETGLYWSRGLGMAELNGDGAIDLFEATTADDHVWFNTSPPVLPPQEGWQRQTLDDRGDVGYAAALALDGSGHPHVAYFAARAVGVDDAQRYVFEYRLRYARWDGLRWHREDVPTGLASGPFLGEASLAVDPSGRPHIVYEPLTSDPPRYVYWDGSQWVREDLFPTQDSIRFSVKVDANGTHLSYVRGASLGAPAEVRYALRGGSGWQEEVVDTTHEASRNTSLALDAGGGPHVTWTDCATPACSSLVAKYARKSNGAWQPERVGGPVFSFGGTTPGASLALDATGRPHVGFVRETGGAPSHLTYATRVGSTWALQDAVQSYYLTTFAIDVDSAGSPHFFYRQLLVANGNDFSHARLTGTAWQHETVDVSRNADHGTSAAVGMQLDANDDLHAAYQEPEFKDLRYVSWAADWQTRALPETGSARAPSIDVEDTIPHIGYHAVTKGQVKLASAVNGWDLDPLDSVAAPVTDLSVEAASLQHVSYYDADDTRLIYAYRDASGSWHPEVVDEAGDVGSHNELVLVGGADASPRIAYWDATSRRVKLAVPVPSSVLWDIYPNNAGPPQGATSGPLSASVLAEGDVGVSYYDGASGDLRLAVWDGGTWTWTDELVDGAGDTGRLSSLQTDGDGTPVVAYVAPGGIRMAYKVGGTWQSQDVPGTGGAPVTSLALELGLNSRRHARIAYTRAGAPLQAAELRGGIWTTRVVAPLGAAAPAEVSGARDGRLHLAYTRGGALQYAFRTANLDVDLAAPSPPPPSYFEAPYNPLDAWQAGLGEYTGKRASGRRPASRASRVAGGLIGSLLTDNEVIGGLAPLFGATTGGQHFVDLYFQHGTEMGRIGLDDPLLLWDAYGTLQNFLPGLEALLTGHGDEVVVTQRMVDDARSVWQRLAAAGSPQLAAAIQTELVRFNGLQDFVDLTFDEWAEAIGVAPPRVLLAGDALAIEGNGAAVSALFEVRLSTPGTQPVLVDYATVDQTAVAGVDYTTVSGTLTFAAGAGVATLSVPVLGDTVVEGNETFALQLTNAVGASLGDAQGTGAITDDDATPALFVQDTGVVEGDGGTKDMTFTVRLTAPHGLPVTTSFATADGTATAPLDYAAATGTLTFPPGTTARPVAVAVISDYLEEPVETLRLDLASPQNATVLDGQSVGAIVDDDSRYVGELSHGHDARADMAALPGPVVRERYHRMRQEPRSSYEVVLDEASGDLAGPAGPRLERLGPDGSTILQSSRPAGAGPARSLRWQNTGSAAVTDEIVRVASAGCTTDCGVDDTYRLRVYETTGRLPRFNNVGSQVTVVLLENRGAEDVSGVLWFWSASGAPLASRPFALVPRATLSLNSSTVPGLAGQGGSATVSHDGPHGSLAGKAVALEPATGLAFDTPLELRPR